MLKANLFSGRPEFVLTALASVILTCGEHEYRPDGSDNRTDSAAPVHDAGRDAESCVLPLSPCGNECVDTNYDVNNCGLCGNICASGYVCSRRSCERTCDSGLTNCDDSCVDFQTDPNHCGSCNMACQFDHATPACEEATCVIAACEEGYADCNSDPSDGCEVALASFLNCGACGNVCTVVANGVSECVDNDQGFTCAITSCNSGHTDCDADYANGCEINTRADASNCGGCGNACSYANAGSFCSSSTCTMGGCNPGYGNCDGTSANGCETATSSSLSHCGSCGRACSVTNGTAGCTAGLCTVASCNSGYANCDGDPANGCEININTDVNNCGGCGIVCPSRTYSLRSCTAGACEFTCLSGFADCDGTSANGCEINTRYNVNHCGGCGNACSYANAGSFCSSSTCTMGGCNPGYGNCDGTSANGCETATSSSLSHCGSCGRACSVTNGTAGCTAGLCTVASCNSGYANCDGDPANGCEININTDVNNCGGCGIVCPSRTYSLRSCTAGACEFTCLSGFADCDGTSANGCEINTRADASNCGGCGNICPTVANSSPWCTTDSACEFTCFSGYADCDGTSANGCEINRWTDSNNCGLCGRSCTAEQSCFNGSCEPRGYAFGANQTEGCSATLRSSCGTNMRNFSSLSYLVGSTTLQECLEFPTPPYGARLRVSFDYAASASTCFNRPSLIVSSSGTTLTSFTFPSCTTSGSNWLDFTLPVDQNTFALQVDSGDWCASVRVTSVTQR